MPTLLREPGLMCAAFGGRIVLGQGLEAIHDELDRAAKKLHQVPLIEASDIESVK